MPKLSDRLSSAFKLRHSSVRDYAGVAVVGTGASIAFGTTGAAALAFAGVSALTGGAAVVALGAVLLAPTVKNVFFPRSRMKNHNVELSKQELNSEFWDCHIFAIGVIGPSGTGKTTIKQLIRGLPAADVLQTVGKEYHLVKIGPSSTKFGALIDGAGTVEVSGDQANLAREANILIVVFDHFDTRKTKKPNETGCDQKRLNFHKKFVKDVFTSLSISPPAELRRVIFLMNKKDLWQSGSDRKTVERWMESLKSDIKKNHGGNLPDPLIFRPFDKDDKADIAWLVDQLQKVIG
jgi:hypothetical protein